MDTDLFLINTDDFQSNEAETSKPRHHGLWNAVLEKLQELILLGIFMGTLSFTIDLCAEKLRMRSGIPVIKTILGGLNLKEYLSCRVLICKTVVLILILGSGLPLGKEDPFVHIAVMLATLLNKASRAGSHLKNSEVHNRISNEILAAASAVGIACTLGTPIGGVLFSIEITSVCFPLQGYWRGFIASVTSTDILRFFGYFIYSTTSNDYEKSYRPVCYSAIIVIIIMSLMCPMGYGHYFAGGLIPSETVPELLSNVSWNLKNYTAIDSRLIEHWSIDRISVFLVLPLYALNLLWIMAVILTLPIPCGVYMPVFVIGAAFGRLLGEAMTVAFPEGLRNDGEVSPIIPGAYAVELRHLLEQLHMQFPFL
ncbi:Chloride channel protein 2 [Trichinella pseudospiralis]|uniref:Chloride channel protein 2 n=1 Tax=Trichinella pseudospiralis TaxID=6337 RepID=A0A0V0Y4W0_TRIPS|nr:Chloride channel protein 2 [Trichinella pseudospiralis]